MFQHVSERQIEDYFFDNPNQLLIAGNPVVRWIGRQVQLPSGILDLVGIYLDNATGMERVVIVEIKKGELKGDAIAQVCRYAADLEAIHANCHHENGPITKMVLGASMSTKLMLAALACDVLVAQFELSIVANTWHLNESYMRDRSAQLHSVADSQFGSELLKALSNSDQRETPREIEQLTVSITSTSDRNHPLFYAANTPEKAFIAFWSVVARLTAARITFEHFSQPEYKDLQRATRDLMGTLVDQIANGLLAENDAKHLFDELEI